eukprot:TRINITY_DN25661_c0_g1_i1.p1 TRINITY_DN25661_c0_g1~~TRINITY_DN25661_c0_g1_i1.p1  ORF type:complete len:380 (-),score=69.99 TRINITY_DN25661_c0_g1_i1:18-1157(-)
METDSAYQAALGPASDAEAEFVLFVCQLIDEQVDVRKLLELRTRDRFSRSPAIRRSRNSPKSLRDQCSRKIIDFCRNYNEDDRNLLLAVRSCPSVIQERILESCNTFSEWLIVKNFLHEDAVTESVSLMFQRLQRLQMAEIHNSNHSTYTNITLMPPKERLERTFLLLYDMTTKNLLTEENKDDIAELIEKKNALQVMQETANQLHVLLESNLFNFGELISHPTFRFIFQCFASVGAYFASAKVLQKLRALIHRYVSTALKHLSPRITTKLNKLYKHGLYFVLITSFLEVFQIQGLFFKAMRIAFGVVAFPYTLSEKTAEWQLTLTWIAYMQADRCALAVGKSMKALVSKLQFNRQAKEIGSARELWRRLITQKSFTTG